MTTYKIGRDVNGNKVVRVSIPGERGFSIQTNGNLPSTERDGADNRWTPGEVADYVKNYGTPRQKELLGR